MNSWMDRATTVLTRAVFVFLYVPIVAVVVYSFNASEVSYRFTGLTLRWYAELAGDERLLETVRTSVVVGVLAGVAATAVGFVTAFALVRRAVRGRALVLGAVLVPMVVPEIVLGVSLLEVFDRLGVRTGLTTLVLGHIVITLPLATLVQMGAMQSLDPSLSEAAADLGADGVTIFRRVLFPLLRPSVLAAFLLSFTTSFSNIVISTFTSGLGTTTLPLRIYSSLKTGLTPELNALGTVMVLFTLVVILLVGVRQMRRILA